MNNRTLFGVLSICTLNIGAIVFFIIGLINGIKILQMSDAEFEAQKANFGAKLFG